MRVVLDTFARAGIEECGDGDLAAGVRLALRHFVRRLESGCEPPAFPRFRRSHAGSARKIDLELEVEPEIQAVIAHKAEELDLTVGQLAAHATLVYLAGVDREAARGAKALGLR